MPADHEAFRRGDLVIIADRGVLERYHRCHGYAYGVTDEQLVFDGQEAQVINVGYYHCGVVLLQLGQNRHHLQEPQSLPGVWFEECVMDWALKAWDGDGYPVTSTYYSISPEKRGSEWYSVVHDPNEVECLIVRCSCEASAKAHAQAVREVAAKRHILMFQSRYGFSGTFVHRNIRRKAGSE